MSTKKKSSTKKSPTKKQSQKTVSKQPQGGALRHRKILRDNIAGITKPAIVRILRRAGIKRINGLVYEEVRGILKQWLQNILRDMIIIMNYARRKTLETKDLSEALEIRGIMLAAGTNDNAKRTASLQSCNSRGKSSRPHRAPATEGGEKKAHRFKPGTVAKREIQRQQKNSDCLAIPKTNFNRLAREVAQDFNDDTRFSKQVFELLQLAAEDFLIGLAAKAHLCCQHAKRDTVSPADFQLARSLSV